MVKQNNFLSHFLDTKKNKINLKVQFFYIPNFLEMDVWDGCTLD